MKISFDGIGEKAITFIGNGVKAGDAVKVTGAGTVSPCQAGDCFDGFAAGMRGEYAAVVIAGAVTVPYSGDAPGFGRVELFADGEGGVTAAASVSLASEGGEEAASGGTTSGSTTASGGSGMKYLVVDVDETDETVTFIM